MNSLTLGLFAGIFSVIFQSTAYLFSARFTRHYPKSALTFLLLSHAIMGCFAAATLLLIRPTPMPPLGSYMQPLIFNSCAYLLAQLSLFAALRQTDASRISPLLGIKIIFIAAISALFLHQTFNLLQWASILLCLSAALSLNHFGGTMAKSSIAWVISATLLYSIADVNIKIFIETFSRLGLIRASMLAASLTYCFCGLLSIGALLLTRQKRPIGMWMDALPFAMLWYLTALFLFFSFGSLGIVYGNIVQSSRGIVSVVIGWAIALMGFTHLEQRTQGSVIIRRVLAALLMSVAIALFYWGKAQS
jgi:uncharacterized membrane protein